MTTPDQPQFPAIHGAARDWAPVARDQRTGHYWFLRRKPVRLEWNRVQCGCCGLIMTSKTLEQACEGITLETAHLFADLVIPVDENEAFINE